jgi:flavin-dependent dehydrogenase
MQTHERIVVGAGPAGSAAAVLLAQAGQPPLLLERSARPQPRLCGEFISAEAADALATLGVEVAQLGGQPTRFLRLACGNQLIEAELPFTAFGLSRNVLDGALQARAHAVGATLWRGARAGVQQLSAAGRAHVLRVTTTRGMTVALQADNLLLACGKTDIAALQRRPRRAPEPLIGLQLHLRLLPQQMRSLRGHVEVMLFDSGYGGLQPVEDDRVNLCLLLRRGPKGAHLPLLLQTLVRECPLLEQRLQGASWDDAPPRSIFRVPYGYLHRPLVTDPPGIWRLGDQAAVIPSFTGDGVAIALHSAAVAAEELRAGSSARHYHERLRRDLYAQMIRAQTVYGLGRHRPLRGALLSLLCRGPALSGWLAQITRVDAAALRL